MAAQAHVWRIRLDGSASERWLVRFEGTGLCARAPIRAGEVVFVWGGGRVISTAELRAIAASGKRYSSAAIGEDEHIVWDVVDADAGGPGGANHSCDPNL